ncbi:hypothetical protein AB1Y20_007588 [Prymnesium parvum]|uniref:Dihydrolipoamide acetyltransferase component of pyruvate dehydrogenase complex n=1 Tax=Prymnesium parvum TaxID=97485 RepID=A0AB34IVB1_PRYPA
MLRSISRLHALARMPLPQTSASAVCRVGRNLAVRSLSSAAGKPFMLADIGEGIAEVEVLQWFVKPGDTVEQFDRLCEVQSDKATVEISSSFEGSILSLAYEVGAIAKVGTPLLHWSGEGTAAAPPAPAAAPPPPPPPPPPPASPATPSGAGTPFMLADIGEGIAEVEVLQWFVKPGARVEQFDRLCEVQSDKATVEISSPFEGVINSVAYEVGAVAKVGTPLLHWSGAAAPAAAPAPTPAAVAAAPAPTPPASPARHGKVLASPATRFLAKQKGIDLTQITGTAKGGRISKADLLAFIASPSPASKPTPAAAPAAAAAAPPPPPRATPAQAEDVVEPIRGIRRAMFKTMTAANAVPHFSYCDEVMMDAIMAARGEMKEFAASLGVPKFTLMPLLMKATSLALADFPLLNSSVSDDGTHIIIKAAHNIGVAMDTPSGLLVPNVKDVRNKTLLEIAVELARLQADASAGKLKMEDLKGGTFSLSNIGNLGGTYTGPVINLPEVAIAGLGKTRPSPRYDASGNLVRRHVMQVSWSADHRIIDGATMARFSNAWIGYLESPAKMLLKS